MLAENIERIVIRVAIVLVAAAVAAGIFSLTPNGRAFMQRMAGNGTCEPNCLSTIDLAEEALQRGDPAAAKQLAAQAILEGPPDPSVDYRAGNVALGANDEKAAADDYLAGERHGPTFPWNFIALGQLDARKDNLLEADANLRAAVSIAPAMQFLHYDLGTVELREGLGAAAQSDFAAELKLSPGYAPAIRGEADAAALASAHGAAHARLSQRTVAQNEATPRPTPTLGIKLLVAPSPTPKPTPEPTPAASPATSTPSPTKEPTAAPIPIPTRIAQAPHPKATMRLIVRPLFAPSSPASPPPNLSDIATDARGYLLGVSQDLSFTRALPAADTTDSATQLETKIEAAHAKPELLRLGTGALLQGDLSAAASAFSAASLSDPSDWRPVYLAGLTAYAQGDSAAARTFFETAARLGGRPEPHTSLAIQALAAGDLSGALAEARRASALDPSYEPARFTSGMLAIIAANAPLARVELRAAIALGGAPDRAGYFLNQAGG